MQLTNRFGKLAIAAVLGITVAFGVAALVTETAAAKCSCGTFYSYVKCSNGKTYQNQCYATCAGATGCVPIGPPPR